MSLILTQINKYGIIFATDSNITINNSKTKEGKKIFKIPHLKSALCLAGSYTVGREPMNKWMPNYIKNDQSKTLEEFTKKLAKRLEQKMSKDEKKGGCIIHISGFVKENNNFHIHPEMWHISNVHLKPNGQYSSGKEKFHFSEDFWNRDFWNRDRKDSKLRYSFRNYGYQYYINGFTGGRVSFNILTIYLNEFLKSLWLNRDFKFRAPMSLDEYKKLVIFSMNFISLMFNLSDYCPKYIGGKTQIHLIKAPNQTWFTQ